MCLVAVPAGASPAPGAGSPDGSTDEIPTDGVVVSFSGELTPLQIDEEGGGEVSTFGSLTLDGECRVTAGTLTADGVVLDDAVSLEGSTAVTLATGEPTLFVNALGGSDVATVRADPDGAISGTARVSDGEVDDFYRVRGSWTSSDVLPACIVADSGRPRPVEPGPEPDEAAGPAQPRITGIVPGPAGSGAVSVVFESGDDWAPASEAALTRTAVLGVQYRVDTGRWQPAQVPSGRGGTFSVWGLPERTESRIEVRTVGSQGYSEPSEAVAVTPAAEDSVSDDLELVRSDCADVPLPTTTIESVDVSPSLEVAVSYSLAAGGGNDLDAESACMASLEWSVAGDGVPGSLRHQTLDLPESSDAPEDTFTFSAFGLPAGTWTVTVDATSKGDPYAESTAAEPFEVGSGPPPMPPTQDCEASAPSVPSLTAPEKNPDGSYTVGFALSAPDGAAAGDCTTRVSAWVPSAGLADTPVELDGAGGSFTVPGDLSPGVHEVSIATANAADPRFTRAVGSALLAVPTPGSVEDLEVSYGQERFAFATGANVGIQPPAVLGADDDPAFAALADLPVGLFLDPQTGAVFGTAVRPTDGPLSVPIRVTDDDGSSATAEVHLEVADPGDDSGLVGYPEGIWAPEGEVIAVTPIVDGGVAGTISNSDSAIPVEPFSGTVLWGIPPAAGAAPATSTTAEAATTGNTDDADEEGDPPDPEPQAEGAGGEVQTAVMYATTDPESRGDATLTATAFDPAEPVAFEAAPDGSCDHRGPGLYRSRDLLAGSSVGLLPKLPASSEPTRFEVTDGALPPGITLDAASGALLGSPERDGDFGFSLAAEFSNSTRRTAQVTLAVEASSESVSYPAVMHTVSGESFEAVPQISGEEVEELLSLVCGTLPRGLAFDDRSGAVEGIVGASGTESESGGDDNSGDGNGPGTRDPNAPISVVVASDIESEVVTASMVLSVSPEPLPQLGYPAQMRLLTDQPVELSPSLAAMPDEAEFKVSNGALPPGLRLRPGTGEVVGSAARGSDPAMVTISATDDEGELVAAATVTLTVEDHTEEGSRWWWLWFVAGAVAMAGTAVAELGRRARAPREADQG